MLNRLGHCENYSFLLELETALAVAVDNESSLLPPGVVRNPSCASLFHSDFDNFDVFVNELFGAGSVHRAHGIMLQELTPEQGEIGGTKPVVKEITRTGQRSLRMIAEPKLQACYMGMCKYPQYSTAKNRRR